MVSFGFTIMLHFVWFADFSVIDFCIDSGSSWSFICSAIFSKVVQCVLNLSQVWCPVSFGFGFGGLLCQEDDIFPSRFVDITLPNVYFVFRIRGKKSIDKHFRWGKSLLMVVFSGRPVCWRLKFFVFSKLLVKFAFQKMSTDTKIHLFCSLCCVLINYFVNDNWLWQHNLI